jgi:hypothetical protein
MRRRAQRDSEAEGFDKEVEKLGALFKQVQHDFNGKILLLNSFWRSWEGYAEDKNDQIQKQFREVFDDLKKGLPASVTQVLEKRYQELSDAEIVDYDSVSKHAMLDIQAEAGLEEFITLCTNRKELDKPVDKLLGVIFSDAPRDFTRDSLANYRPELLERAIGKGILGGWITNVDGQGDVYRTQSKHEIMIKCPRCNEMNQADLDICTCCGFDTTLLISTKMAQSRETVVIDIDRECIQVNFRIRFPSALFSSYTRESGALSYAIPSGSFEEQHLFVRFAGDEGFDSSFSEVTEPMYNDDAYYVTYYCPYLKPSPRAQKCFCIKGRNTQEVIEKVNKCRDLLKQRIEQHVAEEWRRWVTEMNYQPFRTQQETTREFYDLASAMISPKLDPAAISKSIDEKDRLFKRPYEERLKQWEQEGYDVSEFRRKWLE